MPKLDPQLIRVGLVGAGCMGRGIAFQIHATPNMTLAWVADLDMNAACETASLAPDAFHSTDLHQLLKEHPINVLIEATNSIEPAADYCRAALENQAHIVLMNAEVDLAHGPELAALAAAKNLTITSDAGDQHGVLATMIQEADLMGFDIIQAGNIKGFLDTAATPHSIREEAAKRNLSPTQCCAYTDGTKLHIEMAVLANALGYLPPEGGMTGPTATRVEEALTLFDFDSYKGTPRIDYLLGAQPGGGVYLIVTPKKEIPPEQAFYLNYYKLNTSPCGKYYLLYRPYHLCHLETPRAVLAAVARQPILTQRPKKTCDVYAYAKCDLPPGTKISHAIGSAELYGRVEPLNPQKIPIATLEAQVTLTTPISQHQALTPHHLA
ncbi:homoserine dehydrogenase [Luteolibacter sp. AS25]|uniref:homoserine dehydrogenase n=1 Tax=Luteolibacter sp. AS25 TaxID=3135776 RepID=UPI00398A7DEA